MHALGNAREGSKRQHKLYTWKSFSQRHTFLSFEIAEEKRLRLTPSGNNPIHSETSANAHNASCQKVQALKVGRARSET